ncbi:hypothetical protein QEH59_15950 [Coraliomargarita sp. SDUM461004]|uniref:Alpha/beta hydrolase n=1 Tax=Thalassobacterium sedimentorum TaxID=3041258 RepID=A0ABU1AMB4_9BACT|nr:hypothetical protein [Coraliomargarita sp. SDUM461004]MDQ8195928.1 hypothetical protein [Coraliomargarita sp. SDUM461004]
MEEPVNFSVQVDSETAIEAYTELDNYRIEENPKAASNLCAIYFSSNDIYYPNTEAVLRDRILEKDRYEWYPNRIQKAQRHIFVRDIRKQWFLTGINQSISSIPLLCELLAEKTKGMKVVTIGSSAGGYAAILVGQYLNAQRILAFNPQFSIEDILVNSSESRDPIVFRNAADKAYRKYFDITEKVSERVYYFCSIRSGWDKEQLSLVEGKPLNILRFRSSNHGIPFPRTLLQTVINLSDSQLQAISRTEHHPIAFSIRHRGFFQTLLDLTGLIKKRIKKKRLEKKDQQHNG